MPASDALVSELRTRLGSPSASEVSDADLRVYLTVSLRELNRYKPTEGTATLSLEEGVSTYDFPADAYSVGIRRIRRIYHVEVAAPSEGLNTANDDGHLRDDLAGLSPSANWTEGLEHRMRDERNRKMYGGSWQVEAGQIIISPPPSDDLDVMLVYPRPWEWDEVEADDELVEDVMLHALHQGYGRLATSRGKIAAVSRIGQSTSFRAGQDERRSADSALSQWESRVKRARVGPSRG